MFRTLCVATALLVLNAVDLAAGSDYQFQTISLPDTVYPLGFYEVSAAPQIDASGAVYFQNVIDGGKQPITRGTTTSLIPVVEVNGEFVDVQFQSVSSTGEIAFGADTSDGATKQLYRTDAGTNVHIPYPLGPFVPDFDSGTNRAWINNSGTVVYNARFGDDVDLSPYGIISSLNPSVPLVLSGPGEAFAGLDFNSPPIFLSSMSLNDSGDVVFWGDANDGNLGVYRVTQSGSVTKEYDFTTGPLSEPTFLLDQNNDGTSLVAGRLKGVNSGAALYTVHDGVITQFLNTSVLFGPDRNSTFDINNHGEIVLQNQLADGRVGIFDGPDAMANKVIAVGDPLAGSTVVRLQFYHGLNDSGQIAFWAQLLDGRAGIFRADPLVVPEPSTLALAGIGGLVWLAFAARRRSPK